MTNDQGMRFIRRFARFSRTPDGVLLLLAKVGGLATSVPGRRGRSSARSISFQALPLCTIRNEVEISFLTLHRQPRNNSRQVGPTANKLFDKRTRNWRTRNNVRT